MTDSNPPVTQKPIRGCQTFAKKGFKIHLFAYAGSITVWLVIYTAVVTGIGSPELITDETADGLVLRQLATGTAGVATGLYFAGAYMRALGAPLPNLLAASAISALMPARVLAFGNTPPSPALIGSNLLRSTLVLSGGSAVTLVVIIGWYYARFGGTGTREANQWESEYFPPGFRLAISATDSGRIDWEQAEYGFSEWSFWKFLRNGVVVLSGGSLLYGLVHISQAFIGERLLLQMLMETPWVLLALVGVVYVWWVNHQWRSERT